MLCLGNWSCCIVLVFVYVVGSVNIDHCLNFNVISSSLTAAEATSDIITKQLPKLKSLMTSGELHVDNIDVFCEKGVFELEDTEKILKAGKDIGLEINFHAEELNQLNSVEVEDFQIAPSVVIFYL